MLMAIISSLLTWVHLHALNQFFLQRIPTGEADASAAGIRRLSKSDGSACSPEAVEPTALILNEYQVEA